MEFHAFYVDITHLVTTILLNFMKIKYHISCSFNSSCIEEDPDSGVTYRLSYSSRQAMSTLFPLFTPFPLPFPVVVF